VKKQIHRDREKEGRREGGRETVATTTNGRLIIATTTRFDALAHWAAAERDATTKRLVDRPPDNTFPRRIWWTVDVDDSGLFSADSQPKSIGLV